MEKILRQRGTRLTGNQCMQKKAYFFATQLIAANAYASCEKSLFDTEDAFSGQGDFASARQGFSQHLFLSRFDPFISLPCFGLRFL